MLRHLMHWIGRSLEVARSRHHLARLDADALEDLGLTPSDVAAECARAFWDWNSYGRHDHRIMIGDRRGLAQRASFAARRRRGS